MEILIVFGLKLIDNTFSTVKTLFLNKEKFWRASLFAALSTTFYTVAIVRIAKSDSIYSLMAVCLATFIGTLLPGMIFKKSEKDKLWIFDITSDTLDKGMAFSDSLRNENIAIKTSVVYDKMMVKTLSIKAYCANREESRLLNEIMAEHPEFRYNVYVPLSIE